MPPVVIHIQESLGGDEEVLWLESALPKAKRWVPLTCRPTESPFAEVRSGSLNPDRVREAGTRLFQNLTLHPAISARLGASVPTAGAQEPIYLHLQATRAEALPWEALFDTNMSNFCALSYRPIGRIVDSSRSAATIERQLATPVRLVTVIAAGGIDPMPEWQKLEQAIKAAGFPLQVHALVANEALKQHIDQLNDSAITAEYIVDRDQLLASITEHVPHILHFFCHGSAEYGAHLDIVSHADDEAGETTGSVKLEGRDFDPPDVRKALWFTTLNACEGAAGAADELSLARTLVDVGIPVVIAMRERVDAAVAHVVTESFYASVFAELKRLLDLPMPADGSPLRETIEWSEVLSGTRDRLIGWRNNAIPRTHAARSAKEWTLPALYVRSTPALVLVRENTAPLTPEQIEVLGELNKLRQYRDAAPAGTPAAVLDQISLRIAQLEQVLRGN
jgi:hypothetical protein